MFGIIYLLIAWGVGDLLVMRALDMKRTRAGEHRIWVRLPAAFGAGILFATWAVYMLAWAFHVKGHFQDPLRYANLIVLAVGALLLLVAYLRKRLKRQNRKAAVLPLTDRKRLTHEAIWYGVLFCFVLATMFYVFLEKDHTLYSGFTVYGDYAPHTAMMRSFSKGTNFPTQYPHFGGEDVKYHFMFQFLIGNLEYLGMRLDIAYNVLSALSLTGFLMILGQIAYRISHRFKAEIWAAVFFFFRSGMAAFQFFWEHWKANDLWSTLQQNTAFIGYTPKENWGLWCYNVYLNQRHLAFGLLIAAVAVWFFMDYLEESCSEEERFGTWFSKLWLSKEAWAFRDLPQAIFLGLLLGLTAFWNGAALIGCLLILMGFAIFSKGKLDYLVTAILGVSFSVLQTKIFIRGSGVSASFYWGFIAEDKSLVGVLLFLFEIGGIFLLGLLGLAIMARRKERVMMLSFLFPLFFAFVGSLTPDITVNHKYIMISWAFLTVFWAEAISWLFSQRLLDKLCAVILVICLTFTGFYDFVVILKDNDAYHRVTVSTKSTLTQWLEDNLTSDDLILTPEYSMNEVTVSGVMMYCGWPYYAWSAGYDTYTRAANAVVIYTTRDPEELRSMVLQEGIDYILFEENMTFEQQDGIEDTIKATYPLVFTSDDGRIRIYRTEESK